MNFQSITEWLVKSGFLKTTGGVFIGSSASLLIAFQQMEHKIELQQIETDKRIESLELKMRADENSMRQYVDGKLTVIDVQYRTINDNVRDIKEELSWQRRNKK